MEKVCIIIGAGQWFGHRLRPSSEDYVIAADGGYARAVEQNLRIDCVVGDFDSLGFVPEHTNLVRHPVMKDDSDMLLAVKIGLEKGYRTFLIYGGTGGRTDHTLANCQVLLYIASQGGRGCLIGNGETMTVIKNGEMRFAPRDTGTLSVFAFGGIAHGVTLEGLLYPLQNADLFPDTPLGLSNEFTGKPARVSVNDGALLLLWSGAFDKNGLC